MTVGTGAISTRDGGSGISSGTAADVRAGFDAQAPANAYAVPMAATIFSVPALIPLLSDVCSRPSRRSR